MLPLANYSRLVALHRPAWQAGPRSRGSPLGPEGEAVVYFRDAKEAAQRARALLCDSSERMRLAAGLHRCIVGGAHTYAHRLATMLGIASGR
jgi:hypothetical protein